MGRLKASAKLTTPMQPTNTFISVSVFLLIAVQVLFVYNLFWSIWKGEKASEKLAAPKRPAESLKKQLLRGVQTRNTLMQQEQVQQMDLFYNAPSQGVEAAKAAMREHLSGTLERLDALRARFPDSFA